MAVIACSARLEPTAHRHRLRLTLAREWRGRVPPAYDEMLRGVRLALPVADQVERQRLPTGAQQELLPSEGQNRSRRVAPPVLSIGPEAMAAASVTTVRSRRRRRQQRRLGVRATR